MSEKVSPKFATKKRKRLNADGPKQRKKMSQRDNRNNQNDSNTDGDLLKHNNDSDMENASAPCHDVSMCEVDVQNPELTSNKVHQVFPVDSLVDKDDAGKDENTARHQNESVHPEENEDPLFGIYETGDNVDYAATRISDDATIENGDDNDQNVVKHDESHDNEKEPKENMQQERNNGSTIECCNQNFKGIWNSPTTDHNRKIEGTLRFEDVQVTDTCITEKEDIQSLKNYHCMKTDTVTEEIQSCTKKGANDTRKTILPDEFVKDAEDKEEKVDNVNNTDFGEVMHKKYEQDNKQPKFVFDHQTLEEEEGNNDVVKPSFSNENVCKEIGPKIHEADDAPAEKCYNDKEIASKKENASNEKFAKMGDSPAYVPLSYEDEQKDRISQIYIESTQRFYSYEDMYSHEVQTEETFETTKLNIEKSIVDGDDVVVEEDHDNQTPSKDGDNQTASQTPLPDGNGGIVEEDHDDQTPSQERDGQTASQTATQSFGTEGLGQSNEEMQPISRVEAHQERRYQVQNSTNFSMVEIGRNILEKASLGDDTKRTCGILNVTDTEQDRSEDGALGDVICEETVIEEVNGGMVEEQNMHDGENEQEGEETQVKEEQRLGPQAAHSVQVKVEEEQGVETLVVQRVEKQAIEEQGVGILALQGVETQAVHRAEKQVNEEKGVETQAVHRAEKQMNKEKEVETRVEHRTEKQVKAEEGVETQANEEQGLEMQAINRAEKQVKEEEGVEKQAVQRTGKQANDSEHRFESTGSMENDEESIQMDITDSQLCDLDWTSISSQRTNELDAKESSKPQLPDGTNIVKGFIKELSTLNMIILKNKRDYEYEKRRQNQLLRQQRMAQSTSRSQWNAR